MSAPAWFQAALARFARCRSGGVAIMSAVFMTCAIACAAIAVDLAHLWVAKRQTQASADLAAIAAVRAPDHADRVVRDTVAGNGVADALAVELEWGSYLRDASLAPAERFTPHPGGVGPGDAARVSVRRDVPLFFGRMFVADGNVEIAARGVASRIDRAGISIGSKLLSLHGGVVNELLSALTGSTISLDAVHYDALAMADADLLAAFDALNTNADLDAVTYNDILGADIAAGDLANAIADISGDANARAALDALGAQTGTVDLSLGDIIDLGPLGALGVGTGAGLLTVGAGDLMSAALGAATGEHQVALDLASSLPGLADVSVDLAVGERPQNAHWLSVGNNEAIVRTAQVRLNVEATLLDGEGALGGALNGLLGLAGIRLDPVRLPLVVEVAAAEARIAAVSCDAATPGEATVTVDVRPAVAEAWIGDVDTWDFADFDDRLDVSPARLTRLRALLLNAGVDVSSYAGIGDPAPRSVTFQAAEAGSGEPRTVTSSGMTESLVGSLTSELDVDIHPLGGLGGVLGGLTSAIGELLSPVTGVLDGLVDGLLAALGIQLGAADVRLDYVACGDARLVM